MNTAPDNPQLTFNLKLRSNLLPSPILVIDLLKSGMRSVEYLRILLNSLDKGFRVEDHREASNRSFNEIFVFRLAPVSCENICLSS